LQIPAVCPACGLVFPSLVGGFGRVRIQTVRQPCPRCGEYAHVLDGSFDLLTRTVRLIDGPDFTREIIDQMFGAIDAIKANPDNREEVIAALSVKNKAAGSVLREWLTLGLAVAGLAISGLSLLQQREESLRSNTFEERITIVSERLLSLIEQNNQPESIEPPMFSLTDEATQTKNRHQRRVERSKKRKMKRR